MTTEHTQKFTHSYFVHYPEHEPRKKDPNYKDFNHYHREHRSTARCAMGGRLGFDSCKDAQGNPAIPVEGGAQPGLELHHAHIEFALQNGVDLKLLEKDYPGVSDPNKLGAWVESGANFVWYCAWHHRGAAGVHTASSSDFEASRYVRELISGDK